MLSRWAILGAILLLPAAAPAKTYNLSARFSITNPSGPFNFGHGTAGGAVTNYTTYWMGTGAYSQTGVWSDQTGTCPSGFVFENRAAAFVDPTYHTTLVQQRVAALNPCTSSADVAVSFVAPATGNYSFTGSYAILDNAPNPITGRIFNGATEISSIAFRGGINVLTGPPANLTTLKPGGRLPFAFTLSLAKGNAVTFWMHPNASPTHTGTALVLKATGN